MERPPFVYNTNTTAGNAREDCPGHVHDDIPGVMPVPYQCDGECQQPRR